jgi:hypothetical protein
MKLQVKSMFMWFLFIFIVSQVFLVYDKSYAEEDTQGALNYYVGVSGNKEEIENIIDQGVDLDAAYENTIPLNAAVLNIHNPYEMVDYLISKGADVNGNDSSHGTPLHCAARAGSRSGYDRMTKIVELLLQNGADINAKVAIDYLSDTPITPLDAAIYNNDKEMEDFLESKGAVRAQGEDAQGQDFGASAGIPNISEGFESVPGMPFGAEPLQDVKITEENVRKALEVKKEEFKIAEKYGMEAFKMPKAYVDEINAAAIKHGLTPQEYMVIMLNIVGVGIDQNIQKGIQAGEFQAGEVRSESQISPEEARIIKKYLPQFKAMTDEYDAKMSQKIKNNF